MSVLGNILSRTFSPPSRTAKRIDNDLPLNLKIGSLVSIGPTPFIFAEQAGLLLTKAPERQQIAGWGEIGYQGTTTHRFYFEDGEHMLQVLVDGAGKVDGDPFLYKLQPEIRPETDEALANWLADESRRMPGGSMINPKTKQPVDTGRIGYKTFELFDMSVEPPKSLANYARVWKKTVGDQALRERMTESLWREPYDGRQTVVEHECMMYGRKPPNPGAIPAGIDIPDEWLLVTYAKYPAGDNVVQIYVGMPIAAGNISVVLS